MKFYLTFDCEDFVNPLSTRALEYTLKMLQKYNLKGIFFLTGQYCEILKNEREILDLLEKHEIGYHSTSHSVHPGIFEYTDVEDYGLASKIALERETSRINPLTGEIEDDGGLLVLRDFFPKKKIVSFRAPGFCWSPPHLEALGKLGIRFDFSTNLSPVSILYKKITFYPFPILGAEMLTSAILPLSNMKKATLARVAGKSIASYPLVFSMHPHQLTIAENWDCDYFAGNPKKLRTMKTKHQCEIERITRCFELFLRRVSFLNGKGLLEVTSTLEEGLPKSSFAEKKVMSSYRRSIIWCNTSFNYNPQFLLGHFCRYFDI